MDTAGLEPRKVKNAPIVRAALEGYRELLGFRVLGLQPWVSEPRLDSITDALQELDLLERS